MTALLFSTHAMANDIDPSNVQLQWMNGPDRDSVYSLADHTNKVHLWEAFGVRCGWCHRNAAQVAALWEFYQDQAENDPAYERVQFLDLGLDSSPSDFRSWIARHSPDYPVVRDAGQVWRHLRQGNGIPQTFVTDCQGNLVGATIGYWDGSSIRTLKRAIDEALAVECE